MIKITRKKLVVGGIAAAIVAGGAGAALAYWSTSGSGSGAATTTAGDSHLTITQTAAPTNLAPGVAAGSISGTVKNTADNSAYVHQVTVAISSVTKAVGAPAGTCDATDYTLGSAVMTVDQELAKDQTVSFSGANLAFNDKSGTNQDACKGATVNLSYVSN